MTDLRSNDCCCSYDDCKRLGCRIERREARTTYVVHEMTARPASTSAGAAQINVFQVGEPEHDHERRIKALEDEIAAMKQARQVDTCALAKMVRSVVLPDGTAVEGNECEIRAAYDGWLSRNIDARYGLKRP